MHQPIKTPSLLGALALLLCTVAVCSPASAAAAPGPSVVEFPICTAAGTAVAGGISGNTVVFSSNRNGNNDIYGYDLVSKTEFPICTAAGSQTSPAISGNIVVWTDDRNASSSINGYISDIYGYDLVSKTEFPICTDAGSQTYPAISGNIVIWADNFNRPGWSQIDGYDLATKTEFPITTGSVESTPAISGDTVVWQNGFSLSDTDIYGCDLLTKARFPICTAVNHQGVPAISGNTVVWTDQRANLAFASVYGATLVFSPPICATAYGFAADSTSGWHSAAQAVTLTASGGSGTGRTIHYSTDGGVWKTFVGDSVTVAVSREGSNHFQYYASDSRATEATHGGYVNIDGSAPQTTISGVPPGWTNQDVAVALVSSDGLSGIASREYRLGSDSWLPYVQPVMVRSEGETVVSCRAIDLAGNASSEASATVRIDKTGPTTIALAKVRVERGERATFRFEVVDRTPMATVAIGIFSGEKLMKTLALGAKPTGSAQSYVWKCTLAKGRYAWKAYATDLAGNKQSSVGVNKLVVK